MGSAWGIGSKYGGHKDIHPQLGSEEDLKELIEGKEELQINLVGEVMLRGKTQPLNIYSIDPNDL